MSHDDDPVMEEYRAMDRDIMDRQRLMALLSGGALFEYSPEQVAAMQNAGPATKALLQHILEGKPSDDETLLQLWDKLYRAAPEGA